MDSPDVVYSYEKLQVQESLDLRGDERPKPKETGNADPAHFAIGDSVFRDEHKQADDLIDPRQAAANDRIDAQKA